MTISTIIVDVDDTIVDYSTAFFNYHGHYNIRDGYYKNYDEYLNQPTSTSEDHYDAERVRAMVEEFNKSPEFAKLKPRAWAREALHELKRRNFSLHVITSCGNHSTTQAYREHNLMTEFGNIFDDIILLPTMGSKSEQLKRFDPSTTLLVEDNVKNYLAAQDLGMYSMLIDHKFTYVPDDAYIHDDWREIFENIINL